MYVYFLRKHIWPKGKSTTYSHSTTTCGFLLPFTSYNCWGGDLLSSYLVLHEGNRLNCFIHVLLTTLLRLIWLSKWASYMSYVSVSKKVVHIENRTPNRVLCIKTKKLYRPLKKRKKVARLLYVITAETKRLIQCFVVLDFKRINFMILIQGGWQWPNH